MTESQSPLAHNHNVEVSLGQRSYDIQIQCGLLANLSESLKESRLWPQRSHRHRLHRRTDLSRPCPAALGLDRRQGRNANRGIRRAFQIGCRL